MSDSKIVRLGDRTPKSRRGHMAGNATRGEVMDWITAASLAAGKKVYDEIAEQHKATFAIQEQAFMAVATKLHERLARVEACIGIKSPELHTLRDALEAVFAASEEQPAPAEMCTEEETGDPLRDGRILDPDYNPVVQ